MTLSSAILALLVLAAAPDEGDRDRTASGESENWWHQHAPENHMLELGVWGGILIPSRRHEFYDPRVATHARLGAVAPDLGLRFAYYPLRFVGGELEGGLMPTRTDTDGAALLYAVRGHVVGQLPWRLAPFLLVGGGGMGVSSPRAALGKDIDRSFHWGPGLKLFLNRWLMLRVDFRHLVGARRGVDAGPTSHFEILAGLSVTFRTRKEGGKSEGGEDQGDPDGDGYRGPDDACPEQAGTYPDGCPAPDEDSDGVADERDRCPQEPGPAPDGCPAPDEDGDGIADASDKCPEQPGDKPDGCPADSDGDGVRDPDDQCIDRPGDPPDGCPPDADSDGSPDAEDRCKREPETQNGYEDEDGCPDELPQRLRGAAGTMPGITFEVNSATITAQSRPTLDAAAKTLKENPKYLVRIEGHTDSTGPRDHNVALSKRRADAVKDYLVRHGVAPERISAQGHGPDRPIADNATEAGRKENRRIDFKLRRGSARKGRSR